MTLARSRLLQLLGLLLCLAGLVGYWRAADGPRVLTRAEAALINPAGESFQLSFVLAGRDIDYAVPAQNPIYRNGEIVGWGTPPRGAHHGFRTDSIFYVNITGNRAYVVALPRDIYLSDYGRRINAVYGLRGEQGGADGLRRAVSSVLGVPVDHYLIVNIDVFERLVDALGGVTINVPQRMYYVDNAAGLTINLQPGVQRLSGSEAAGFVRYRQTLAGGDLGRIDNIKRLASAMLARVRELNVRAVALIPELVSTLSGEVETTLEPAHAAALLPRLNNLELIAATVPTQEAGAALRVAGSEVEAFLAETFGGTARQVSETPTSTILISNRSGLEGLEEVYREHLLGLGVPADRIITRTLSPEPSPTRLQAELTHWDEARYYASLFNVDRVQVFRVQPPRGVVSGLELVLGEEGASLRTGMTGLAASQENAQAP